MMEPETRELRLLSVVAPAFDEEGTIAEFRDRVGAALEGIPYELVLVDDGSTDTTPAINSGRRTASSVAKDAPTDEPMTTGRSSRSAPISATRSLTTPAMVFPRAGRADRPQPR